MGCRERGGIGVDLRTLASSRRRHRRVARGRVVCQRGRHRGCHVRAPEDSTAAVPLGNKRCRRNASRADGGGHAAARGRVGGSEHHGRRARVDARSGAGDVQAHRRAGAGADRPRQVGTRHRRCDVSVHSSGERRAIDGRRDGSSYCYGVWRVPTRASTFTRNTRSAALQICCTSRTTISLRPSSRLARPDVNAWRYRHPFRRTRRPGP